MPMKCRSIAFWLMLGAAFSCNSEPAMLRQLRKVRLIDSIRQALLESLEAEKSAVLATTDEESKAMADESQQSAAKINQLRQDLRSLVVEDGRDIEIQKLDAFDAAWAEVERVDQRLLALAVANTNVKALRLSATEGASHLDQFVDTLNAMGRSAPAETLHTLSAASIAALRIQALALVHIPSADDAEMTRLEERIRSLGEEVDHDLTSLRESGQVPADQLVTATQAWTDYQRVLKDVLRLSRENTNVISFDVSVHEKRLVTKQCLAALSALLDAVNVGPKATR
jgi:hypothetical protein